MREIKFRAWNDVAKVMYESNIPGLLLHFDGELNGLDENGMLEGTDNTRQHHLMQYTGLKDKNGKEIYEGDIVEYNDFNSLRTGGHAEDKIIVGKVVFSCGMWMVEENNCGHDLYEGLVNDEELEIIGNIYENPELLEGTA